MRISAKGRYGLSAMIYIAQNIEADNCIPVFRVSEFLGISKIYLEQVFSLLKKAGLVNSIKGSGGGYQLSRSPEEITAYDILSAIEVTLFEQAENVLADSAAHIDQAMQELVWRRLDDNVKTFLSKVTLKMLVEHAEENREGAEYMYYL